MDQKEKSNKIRRANLWITGIATPLYILVTIGLGIIAPMSVMAFDAPGSETKWQPWAFLMIVLSWPLVFLLAIILSWVLYKFKKHKASLFILLLPLINLAILILFFATAGFGFAP